MHQVQAAGHVVAWRMDQSPRGCHGRRITEPQQGREAPASRPRQQRLGHLRWAVCRHPLFLTLVPSLEAHQAGAVIPQPGSRYVNQHRRPRPALDVLLRRPLADAYQPRPLLIDFRPRLQQARLQGIHIRLQPPRRHPQHWPRVMIRSAHHMKRWTLLGCCGRCLVRPRLRELHHIPRWPFPQPAGANRIREPRGLASRAPRRCPHRRLGQRRGTARRILRQQRGHDRLLPQAPPPQRPAEAEQMRIAPPGHHPRLTAVRALRGGGRGFRRHRRHQSQQPIRRRRQHGTLLRIGRALPDIRPPIAHHRPRQDHISAVAADVHTRHNQLPARRHGERHRRVGPSPPRLIAPSQPRGPVRHRQTPAGMLEEQMPPPRGRHGLPGLRRPSPRRQGLRPRLLAVRAILDINIHRKTAADRPRRHPDQGIRPACPPGPDLGRVRCRILEARAPLVLGDQGLLAPRTAGKHRPPRCRMGQGHLPRAR